MPYFLVWGRNMMKIFLKTIKSDKFKQDSFCSPNIAQKHQGWIFQTVQQRTYGKTAKQMFSVFICMACIPSLKSPSWIAFCTYAWLHRHFGKNLKEPSHKRISANVVVLMSWEDVCHVSQQASLCVPWNSSCNLISNRYAANGYSFEWMKNDWSFVNCFFFSLFLFKWF